MGVVVPLVEVGKEALLVSGQTFCFFVSEILHDNFFLGRAVTVRQNHDSSWEASLGCLGGRGQGAPAETPPPLSPCSSLAGSRGLARGKAWVRADTTMTTATTPL